MSIASPDGTSRQMRINPGLSIITETDEASPEGMNITAKAVCEKEKGQRSHTLRKAKGVIKPTKEKLRKTILTGKSTADVQEEKRLQQIWEMEQVIIARKGAKESERRAKIEWKRQKRLEKEAVGGQVQGRDADSESDSDMNSVSSTPTSPSRTKSTMLHSSNEAHQEVREKMLALEASFEVEMKKETSYQKYAREAMERKKAKLKAEADERRRAKEEKKAKIWIPKVGDKCLARYKAREEYLPCKIIAITTEIVEETPSSTRRSSLFGTPKSRSSAPPTPSSTLQVVTPKNRHADYEFPSPKAAKTSTFPSPKAGSGAYTGTNSPMAKTLSPKSTNTNSVPPSPSGSVGSSVVTINTEVQEASLLRFTVHYDRVAEHHHRGRKKIEGLNEIEEGVRLDLLAPPRNPHHFIKPATKDLKLSISDQHAAHKARMEHVKKNQDLIKEGPQTAKKRNIEVAKKIWLMEQGPELVRKMAMRKKWRDIGENNRKERRRLQHMAVFKHWGLDEQFSWLKNALLVSLRTLHSILESRKNSKQKLDAHSQDYLNVLSTAFFPAEDKIFDKIGRNMAEVKYRDSRLIKDRDIQRAKNRPLSKVEEYLASTKGTTAASTRQGTGFTSPPRTGVGSPNGRKDTMTASTNKRSDMGIAKDDRATSALGSERAGSPPRTASPVRIMTAGSEDNITNSEYVQKHHKPPAQILEELRREYEIEMNRAFDFFAERLSDYFGKAKRNNTNKMMVTAIEFCAIASNETINNSKFLRILPQEHKEIKLLQLRSQNMAKQYDRLYFACTEFAADIGLVDKAWGRHLAVMLSQSILQKYDGEAQQREQGRNIAASRVSSIFRMNQMRGVLRSVYAQLEVLEQEAIQRNAILRAEQEAQEKREKEEKERKAALAERRKIVGDGAVVYVAEDSLTALLNHRPVKEFINTRPSSPSRSRPSTSYEQEHINNLPFYRMDVNFNFSPNGLALRLDGNIKIRCLVLREPTRRQTRSLPREDRRNIAKWGGSKLRGAGVIGRSLHTPRTADVNHPHYHYDLDGGDISNSKNDNNNRERGVRRTVYESGRLLLLISPAEWNMPHCELQEISLHATWHKRSHGGTTVHLANSYDPNSNPELLSISEERAARMCYVTIELKDLPRDMEYRLHCMIHSTLISQEPWPPIPKHKLRKHEAPAVYSFLSAPAIPVMQNAQKPFLTDKNRISQLTNENDVIDLFMRLQRQREEEEEILHEIKLGSSVGNDVDDGVSVGSSSVGDVSSLNDRTVYSTDDEISRGTLDAENSLRRWKRQERKEEIFTEATSQGSIKEPTNLPVVKGQDEYNQMDQDDEGDVGVVQSKVYQVDDFFDEVRECADGGKGKDFLVSFRTDPTHPDRPRMQPPDVRLEMGGVGLDKVFIPSSSYRKAEHYIIARVLWNMGYTGGLPVDEFELYRRIDTGGDQKHIQSSLASSSSSSSVSSSSSLASSVLSSFVSATSSAPWEMVSQSLESNHLEMLPVAMFQPLMEQQVQFQDEYGIKNKVSNNSGVKRNERDDTSEVEGHGEDEDEFSMDRLKEMEGEGIRVVEVPRTIFVSRYDQNKTIQAKKVPIVRLQYKVRAHNRCGWGYFSKPITFVIRPQREEFSIDRISHHGLGSGLEDEVRERLRALSRAGSRSRTAGSISIGDDIGNGFDFNEMLSSRPPTAYILEEDNDANDDDEDNDNDNIDGISDLKAANEQDHSDHRGVEVAPKTHEGRTTDEKEEEEKEDEEGEEGEFDFEKFLEKMGKLTPLAKFDRSKWDLFNYSRG